MSLFVILASGFLLSDGKKQHFVEILSVSSNINHFPVREKSVAPPFPGEDPLELGIAIIHLKC